MGKHNRHRRIKAKHVRKENRTPKVMVNPSSPPMSLLAKQKRLVDAVKAKHPKDELNQVVSLLKAEEDWVTRDVRLEMILQIVGRANGT